MTKVLSRFPQAMSGRAADEAMSLESLRQASHVGTLADRVVLAALRMEAGSPVAAGGLRAIQTARDLLQDVANRLTAPFDVTALGRGSETLRYLNRFSDECEEENESLQVSGAARKRTAERLRAAVESLDSMKESSATSDQIELVRDIFEKIANSTLLEANDATNTKPMVGGWTQARSL